jgi:uncharacterized protein YndB with AHSA1/START domain
MIEQLGALSAQGERRSVVHECVLTAKRSAVWDAITDAREIAVWMQTEAMHFDHHVGGNVHYTWPGGEHSKGTIMIFEPKKAIAYTWHEGGANSTVRLDLRAEDHATDLTLRHRDLTVEQLPSIAAGWHTHLELLEAMLAGRTLEFNPRYQELLPQYEVMARRL